ncbi:hypothetical protein DUNSADRAFT_15079 [Dunaliella salina]|uniref:Uncharacterized protein n=1 Tax=Dunaliella salina TaxID=3046 RepID=A0ABQ7G627_DUNSA|nr:hypothetical protein DUNSADRAFT_15079 [Dunaliella salina]|eukprot:KAF5830060.1 hypothetical protein DUNSADRAFT_15079 [Dunaliella salina]
MQGKAAQSRQQRKEAEMFAHIRTKLKRLALHHAKYHMEHGADEYEHAHAQQQQLEQNHAHMMQQQQTPTRMQAQQAVVGGQVHKEVHPETQQLSPPNPAAEEEARELASAAETIHQHAQVAEMLCEQEEHASAAQRMREHAPLAEELCGQEELASLFDLPPEEDSSAEAATHAILHPFNALLPTQPQDFSSCMASLCTPPTSPTSSRSLSSPQQHPGASSQQQQQQNSNSSLRSVSQHSRQQQQQQQQNSNNSLLSISQHSRQQQQQQQQQNSHSSLLPTSLHSSGRSRKALSPAHAPLQPASASLFLHGRSGHTSMDSIDLEEEPGNGIVIDSSGKPFAYRRIDTMHARLPDSPK